MEKKLVYVLCPVRNVTTEQQVLINDYVARLETDGTVQAHYPPRDVVQEDETGMNICMAHLSAMKKCHEVHIFWTKDSTGSHVDFGMAFALDKKIKLIKSFDDDSKSKSYLKVIKLLSEKE